MHLSDDLNKLDDAEVVELEDDLYWNILDEDIYSPYEKPERFYNGKSYRRLGILTKNYNR